MGFRLGFRLGLRLGVWLGMGLGLGLDQLELADEPPSGSPRPVSCTSKHTRGSGAPPTSPSAGAA